jgi:methionyl-tRNA formyltransferase
MKSIEELRVIFMGTPDFAVATLQTMIESGVHVVAVVTAPDKPAGRGMQLQASAVKQYALTKGLPVLQPEKLKNPEFLEHLASYHADVQVVVAFRMLPEQVWNMPPMGTINVHASLLPQYRGAAPINRAIMNGETITGVTTFLLQHEIDTGNILLQHEVAIVPEDNAGTLYEKLKNEGARLLMQTLQQMAAGKIVARPQKEIAVNELKHAPKIFKEDTIIDWTRSVDEINNQIRGLAPSPAASTSIAGKNVKIYVSHTETENTNTTCGAYETDGSQYLRVAAGDGWLYIDELQQEGKKRMKVTDFLRGFRQ